METYLPRPPADPEPRDIGALRAAPAEEFTEGARTDGALVDRALDAATAPECPDRVGMVVRYPELPALTLVPPPP